MMIEFTDMDAYVLVSGILFGLIVLLLGITVIDVKRLTQRVEELEGRNVTDR